MSAEPGHYTEIRTFPSRIRELRKARGWSQGELAERIGCVTNHVSDLERGERGLTLEWMRKIALALECSPADLLNYADNPARMSDAERRLLDIYRTFPPEMQEQLQRLAAALPRPADDSRDSDQHSA
jgi:transcriptional regulator with XRE-family HTH domain